MNVAGTVLVSLAAVGGSAGILMALLGRALGRDGLVRGAFWALVSVLASAAAATALLLTALGTRDFGNEYVYSHTSRSLSTVYSLTALWAGNEGSLLLWLLLISLFTVIAVAGRRRRDPGSVAFLAPVLASISLFFSLLILFAPGCDPFLANAVMPVPADGLGLNPILQNPGMVIHPVTLYLGFVALALPFGLAMSGLANGSPLATWIVPLRRWALGGWLFLSLGNVIGGWWAYVTLGWGGYWAWDPVENVSLIPWLTATAMLHSAFIAQRRGRQQLWTVTLAAVSFLLTIVGTFITRTGIASSVHAYAQSKLTFWFVVYLVLVLAATVAVLTWKRSALRRSQEPGSVLDEGSSVFYAVLVLVVLAGLILWGVIFPPIAQSVTGKELVLGSGFFDTVTAPLGLILLALVALCSLAGLSHGARPRLKWALAASLGGGLVVLVTLLAVGVRRFYPLSAFALITAATVAVIARWAWGWRARRGHGALVAHLGLLILVMGLVASWSFKESTEGQIAQGETLALGGVVVAYQDLLITSEMDGDREVSRAVLEVKIDDKEAGRLAPSIDYYPRSDWTWTRVARRTSASGDVYVTLLAVGEDGKSVDIRLELHPLIVWLWIGGGVMSAGGLLALIALRKRS